MHLSEGVLSVPVLAGGAVLAAAGVGIGLKRLEPERIAGAGLLAAGFFVASLIHVPIGPSSAHLVLNGLVGLILGWTAFPVILVALVLQGVFLQFGGITTLGVNTVVMALPAVAMHYACKPFVRQKTITGRVAAFGCGAGAIGGGAVLVALALVTTGQHFVHAAGLILAAHLPVMVVEGLVTLFCVGFLQKVMPEMLPGQQQPHRPMEQG